MNASGVWPDEDTMIPELLESLPHARPVLDRYGLQGCGGPAGPAVSLGYFARAHEVPLDALLSEVRATVAARPAVVVDTPEAAEPEVRLEDAIYRPFFKAGIAIVLTLGAVWGAYLLLQIAVSGKFTAAGLHAVNAHGHAQIFGWVGLFVMGFAYQAFPRFKHTSLARPRLAMATLWMMVIGLVVRSIAQPIAGDSAGIWWVAVGASFLEIAAIALFASIILQTWKQSGKRLAFYDGYILSALGWFVVQAVYESVYLAATLSAQGDDLVALVSTWQPALRDIQIHGFALLMVLGVSQRIFHHFYGLPEPNPRLSLIILGILNLAVIGEVAGLILMQSVGHGWAGLWYVSVLALAASTAVLVKNWRIFSPTDEADRSLKFLRVAYVWLFLSLSMLVAIPVYQFGALPLWAPASDAVATGFSHAYYGAIRHAITVGFVSLMIVGVSSKVVPTLSGIQPRLLSSLWGPFVLINLGCSLRVLGQTATDFTPHAFPVAGVSGLLEVSGLAIWGVHLWRVMSGRARLRTAEPRLQSIGISTARRSTAADAPTADNGSISGAPSTVSAPIEASHTVGGVLEQRPELLETFVGFGFTTLINPQFRRSIARVVTISQACRRMDISEEEFLEALNARRDEPLSQSEVGQSRRGEALNGASVSG